MRNTNKLNRYFNTISCATLAIGAIWFLASWVEIGLNNLNTDYIYSNWNIIIKAIEIIGG